MSKVFFPAAALLFCHWLSVAKPATDFLSCDACQRALVAAEGRQSADQEISQLQKKIRNSQDPRRELDRLGWMYVSKARVSNDPGFYKLAEQAALCLEAAAPGSDEALLLRGHVLHSLHRFNEAEPIARQLTEKRGAPFDYGLLGDVLFDQGRVDDAIKVYQKMVDLKPDLHSYSRIGHVRWVKGDVEGAIEVLTMAAKAANPRAPEPGAWVFSRLALYQFQAGQTDLALQSVEQSLQLIPDYAPALLARGRILLSQGKTDLALQSLTKAAELNPLPDYHWIVADAYRSMGKEDRARSTETLLQKRGRSSDPRTYALYLATRGQQPEIAIQLAREELKSRSDIFTHDALAWALHAGGKNAEAREHLSKALSEGTKDARLFYHASIIAHTAGDRAESARYLQEAEKLKHLLLPSERKGLETLRKEFTRGAL